MHEVLGSVTSTEKKKQQLDVGLSNVAIVGQRASQSSLVLKFFDLFSFYFLVLYSVDCRALVSFLRSPVKKHFYS
jgi:hypothetical protein